MIRYPKNPKGGFGKVVAVAISDGTKIISASTGNKMIRRTRIRRVSKKRAVQLRTYSKLRADFLKKHPVCQVCCNAPATDIHHSWGRIGELLNATEYWFAVCRWCHQHIHNHPSVARRNGYLL